MFSKCFICIAITVVTFCVSWFLIGIYLERKEWNDGVCKKCGSKLVRFDDCHAGRGYSCTNCSKSFIWISYKCIDKNYKEPLTIAYICDRKACPTCNPECNHTCDIKHSVHYGSMPPTEEELDLYFDELPDNKYFENEE